MNDPTINFPKSFWTSEHLNDVWSYARYFLGYNQKLILIVLAAIVAGMVAVMIVEIGAQARSGKPLDDDDFDY